MCDACGCTSSPPSQKDKPLKLMSAVFAANNDAAKHNRNHLQHHGVLAINLMSAPGAGKTSLLEATIDALSGRYRLAVIEGDLETENDAQRIRAKGIPAFQINTGSACHLDAVMVHDAMHHLDLDTVDILFIENIGNLVCPAAYDLGQHFNVLLLSVTEGDDKPAKYPVMFRIADVMLVSKTDLLPYLDEFKVERAETHLRKLANRAPVIPISIRNGAGLSQWIEWLEQQFHSLQQNVPALPEKDHQHL
ncbi:MAG: hydrogenase nickel incorporation protein HypB [Magnetococcales bacterium]|nr:hydrogenase nickel incorporation protein HypB [Magnetococcales bacterium]MBF0151206.1 hydrogenase nickel incorporation protein HypB [Magnetococcales bacterium]MBF0173081.1 hydrogenase nickel incorporation protein HypB [Magnetococcales bacterium]MBF0347235.1 hydrogenase nickel incorporation protein HypB [Magnetococcales bacterium]MBF0630162.1 hydrogenase nickel incorporation protein HypB [Magnetococcales bacterium]